MNEVLVDIREWHWVAESMGNKDLVSVHELLTKIEDLLDELEYTQSKLEKCEERLENTDFDYNPEMEIPEIHGKGITW